MEVEDKKNNQAKNAFYQQRRFWFYIAFFFSVIILFISYLAFQYAINQHSNESEDGFNVSSTKIATSTKKEYHLGCLIGSKLSLQNKCPVLYAVMVENHFDARPLSGIAKADMVFEFPVEGGITRFMAIFNSSSTVAKIGPVRSARPYYVEYARSLDAVYAHVGGSPEALNRINGLYNFKNLDEMANENTFWRDSRRYAPHNAYTSIKKINQAYKNKKWHNDVKDVFWKFIDPEKTTTSTKKINDNTSVQAIKILYGGSYNVKWVYDLLQKKYIRYQANSKQYDQDQTLVEFKNIIIIYTNQKVLDKKGRLRITVNGNGKAIIISNGQQQIVSWHKKSGEFIYFLDEDGQEVKFNPGKTWLSFITLKNQKVIFE